MTSVRFPQGFVWGSATASYQIEGAVDEDGRGESIWDRFAHTPGRTVNGDNGDIACDHYHRYGADIALMKEIGLTGYRFSIAWPRIHPTGGAGVNQAGIDFYNRLIDTLLDAGIQPAATLYHWDMPQTLEDAGGWPNPDTALRFADYAETAYRAFGDRIKTWITLNEPWCAAFLGYGIGEHAPGRKGDPSCFAAGHTLLVAHGLAVQRYRSLNFAGGEIGITDNGGPIHPATDSPEDIAAARRYDAFMNRWFLDPVYLGEYPQELRDAFGQDLPEITDEQRTVITTPIDFLGINYYARTVMADDASQGRLRCANQDLPDAQRTAMGWEIYPDGLREFLVLMKERYNNPPIYVTENGAAFDDAPDGAGCVRDEPRRLYLRDHFVAARKAIDEGVNLKGYFVWSLMDNFEWAHGYTKRFGIVYVDYPTQTRILKTSARWYGKVIEQNAVDSE